ncbi:MAG: hypothetical protein QW735_03210 [archaeon]
MYRRKFQNNGKGCEWVYPVRIKSYQDILNYLGFLLRLLEKGLIEPQRAKLMVEILNLTTHALETSTIIEKVKMLPYKK